MDFDGGLKNSSSMKVLTSCLILSISLLVLSAAVYAGSNVDIWMNKDTYRLGERVTVYFNFPRSGSYTLVQIEPRRSTIIRNQSASAGRNRLTGTIDKPTGNKRIKVIFEDQYGNRETATTSYYVGGGDQSGGQSEGRPENAPSLSYFRNRNPSQAGDVTRSLQNQVQVIRPGDSNYRQLSSDFNTKARSLNFSRNQQNLGSFEFSFGSSDMEFSVDSNKKNYYSLNRSLNNQGATFFGSKGGNNYVLMKGTYDIENPTPGGGSPGGGHCLCRLPCRCVGCCSPIFICLPSWFPWPLPTPWIIWILLMT